MSHKHHDLPWACAIRGRACMRRSIVLMAALVGVILSGLPERPAWSAEVEDLFIIGDVYSRVGRDFYQGFCRVWNSMDGVPARDIVITEEPGGTTSSRLQVLVGGSVTYIGTLGQRGMNVREEVDRAVSMSVRHIVLNLAVAEEVAPELYGPGIGAGI